MSSASIIDADSLKVWAAVLLGKEKVGVRRDEIISTSQLPQNTVECALQGLVALGFVSFQLLQVGTAGTAEKFYQTSDGAYLYHS